MKFTGVRIASIAVAVAAAFALNAAVGLTDNSYINRLFVLAGLFVTLSVSLNLINGITGQFSIGHAAFYQVGAYVAGYVSKSQFDPNGTISIYVWIAMMAIVGAIAAAAAGFIVGLPSLRLRGDYLAIVTLGFGEIVRILAINSKAVGGSIGMNLAPKEENLLVFVFLLAVLAIAVCRNLLKCAHGLTFLAVREDEVAASAMGVNVMKTKVIAFMVGSAFAGAAGALLAHFEGYINPDMFKMEVSFLVLTMVVLGGTGSITGSTVAALLLFAIPESQRFLVDEDKRPYIVNGGHILAGVVMLVTAVAVLKWLGERYHGPKSKKVLIGVSTGLGAVVGAVVLAKLLGGVGFLAGKTWEVGQLRMAVLAVTLIIVMLLRPQGVLAHHEFSWDWVKSLFKRRQAGAAA